MKKYFYKERIGYDGKPITQCYVAQNIKGDLVSVLVKPYDTFFGVVKDNVIIVYFIGNVSGMFCSLADYFEEIVENKKDGE